MTDILRNLEGELLGLDASNNLVTRGKRIIMNHNATPTGERTLEINSSGQLLVNGAVLGGAAIDIDAGTTLDLTAILAVCAALSNNCTLRLRALDYVWPAGTPYPLGLNMIGESYDANHTVSAGVGSKISTSDHSILVQALGNARATLISGVFFADGFQVRKQNTTFIGCRFDNNGFILGDNANSCAPYYTLTMGCRFEAAVGGSCIQLQNNANACEIHGNLLVPQNGRGVDFQATAVGNKFTLRFDRAASSATDMGSVVYMVTGTSPTSNEIEFTYFESSAYTGIYRDGGHIVIVPAGASRNLIKINGDIGAALRVVHGAGDNEIRFPYSDGIKQQNANFSWDYSFGRTVMSGSATSVNIPPHSFRKDALRLLPRTAAVAANAAFTYSGAAVNAAGSGGTDGIYYQLISDVNTVTGQQTLVKLTVAGGILTAVAVQNPGWFTVSPTTAVNVTAATNLTGATLTMTVLTHNLSSPGGNANAFAVIDQAETVFAWDTSNTDCYFFPGSPYKTGTSSVSPGTNGNATIAHLQTKAPNWANAHILGDMGGVDIHIEIQAIDATNITLRFSNAAGTDITTGGPYTVRWAVK